MLEVKKTILIIADERATSSVLAEKFSQENFSVLTAFDDNKKVEVAIKNKVDWSMDEIIQKVKEKIKQS
ncbi:MAG: hypothetical protein Q8Q23_00230 [bacterium]|nr:hypothetical protein [bacterium]